MRYELHWTGSGQSQIKDVYKLGYEPSVSTETEISELDEKLRTRQEIAVLWN
jgi:hypothetical protein